MASDPDLPFDDWLTQKDIADLFGVTQKTVCLWRREGKLTPFEHGFPCCGRRRYSRSLLREAAWSHLKKTEGGAVT